jgi:hypothetical protein
VVVAGPLVPPGLLGEVVVGLVDPVLGALVGGETIESPGLAVVDGADDAEEVVVVELLVANHAPPPTSSTTTAAIDAMAGTPGRRFHHGRCVARSGIGRMPGEIPQASSATGCGPKPPGRG